MNPILAAGLLIGVLCGLWTFVMGITGWYKDPVMVSVFYVVVLIEIAGLIWGLRQTAMRGRTYSGQVVAGTLMSIVAGVVIICSSLLFTTVAYPQYFEEIAAVQRQMMQEAQQTNEQIEEALNAMAPTLTPLRYALAGFVGTFVTGVLASAIIAIWIRARGPRPSAARV
jgi:hypothetical protein